MQLGIDLGGTKIEVIALDDGGTELVRRRVPTPASDYSLIVDAIAGLVREVEAELGMTGTVGVATPGAVSPATGQMKNSNTVVLNDRPLVADLSRSLGRPVRIANDANCFVLSEAVDGAAAGAAIVFGIIVGTGTGGGIVVHNRTLVGCNAIVGEWGHNPLPWPSDAERPGPSCYCGKTGCIETFLSGPGVAADHSRVTGESLNAIALSEAALAGDSKANATWERYEDRMARALASIINVLDPDVIVMGGGLSKVKRLYANVRRRWDAYVFSDRVSTRLVPPRHGDSSGVRGAAWLASEG